MTACATGVLPCLYGCGPHSTCGERLKTGEAGGCSLYRCKYLATDGYVVYRASFDVLRCDLDDWVRVHKDAVFVCEVAALFYCRIRNAMTARNGTDALT